AMGAKCAVINGVEAGVIGDVLSFFGAGPARSIEPVDHGISNRNYGVRTDRGEYVVRFLANRSTASVENDIAIQRQLRSAGVPAPEYLRSVIGPYIYEGGSGLRAVISPRLSGITPIQITPVLSFDIGRHLGLFHTSVASLPRPNNASLMNPEANGFEKYARQHQHRYESFRKIDLTS
ncbi:MAG TPA: phosphotransferase, partial [Chloroflexota bacterium]|nr:phosphotransferase [Chloroflexota bacterium]